jgi:putative ABC transport system ATP-binding protein
MQRDIRNLGVDKTGTGPAIHPAIHLEGVHLTLASEAGRVNILQGIGLHIAAGETVSLVGPSGSGKTSLLLLIAGLEQASRGRIAIAGRDLTNMSEDDLALLRRERIGIVFQNFHLIPTMNALENVAIPLELAGAADAFARAQAALGAVGLSHRLSHYPAQLSGGEQQRVALARALAPRPQVLLADEPTGNLDSANGRQVTALLRRLATRDEQTIVMVTHDANVAAQADRLVRLRDGLVESDGGEETESPAAYSTPARSCLFKGT